MRFSPPIAAHTALSPTPEEVLMRYCSADDIARLRAAKAV
jgi:hypothetical protein